MDALAATRLLLVFAHLMLCVFALHAVISTDWRLLRSRISAAGLLRAHRRVVWLLAGLWLSGLAMVAIDTGFAADAIWARPKLVAKLLCVAVLTFNGVLLRLWCFPRLAGRQPLLPAEAMALMSCGALSTTSWLMAAFYGVARPVQDWPLAHILAIYGLALCVALPVALSLAGRLHRGRVQTHLAPKRPETPVAPDVEQVVAGAAAAVR